MSIASCLGALGNTAAAATGSNAIVQTSTQTAPQSSGPHHSKQLSFPYHSSKQQSNGLQSPTLVMNNSSSLSNGSNGLGAFTFGSLSNGSNVSSLSPTDGHSVGGHSNGSSSPTSFTKCVLCGQQYGQPKVMPCCFRTYCLACLEKLQQHQQVKCPGCANEVHLSDNGVAGLHTDYSSIRILDQLNELNAGLTNGNLNGNGLKKELTCSMHGDELLRYYCKTCEQATCKECISFQHQKHDNEYLIEASNKFVSTSWMIIDDGRMKNQKFKSKTNHLYPH